MKIPISITLASLLFIVDANAGEQAPARGVSVCNHGQTCSFAVQRSVGPNVEQSQAQKNIKHAEAGRMRSNTQRGQTHLGFILDEPIGNLPMYLASGERRPPSSDNIVLEPVKISGALLTGLRAGDVLTAELDQSIKASPSVPTPIRARVTAGRFQGAYVLGSATLDHELKRVLLTFERIRLSGNDKTYQLKASGLALSGQVGLEGDYHTQEGFYFVAELGAVATAGYVDATTTRTQNLLGGYQAEPSAANAAKQSAVQALSKSAERLAERARNAPEYTEIEGGRAIQIILQESPTEVTGG
ncbi:MAG: TrbI/VirB10 family protein [Bdellovibrionota bacterium]